MKLSLFCYGCTLEVMYAFWVYRGQHQKLHNTTLFIVTSTEGFLVIVITALSELRKVLFLALSLTRFVYVWNISGTAERICAKFTGKTCLSLAPTSLNVKVEGQGHQGQQTAFFGHFGSLRAVCVWQNIFSL